MFITNNLSVRENGHLNFAGMDTVQLAKKYKTPLYLMDEDKIRAKCRAFKNAVDRYFDSADILYASKAAAFVKMYEIVCEENLCVDVVSGGELYTAIRAGFPTEKIYFHGNNKSIDEIEYAIESGIGHFIVDNLFELDYVNKISGDKNKKQKILLRITPNIDPHTFEAVSTGKIDSKFGFAIETGQAQEALEKALQCEYIEVSGYHCHIGSQVFEHNLFSDSAKIMFEFSAQMKNIFGYEAGVMNLGGGFGIRYVEEDVEVDIDSCIREVSKTVKDECSKHNLAVPRILFEPGRSIVGDSGITLYTVGNIKVIPEYKKYVAVDGGMSDNPRYALYQSPYTAVIANKADKERDFLCTIAGKCCESGDLIQEDVMLQTPEFGDILAVFSTGAYNYSMASNYNKIPRPPIVMIKDGKDYVAVKRESYEDIIKNEIV